MWSNCPDGPLNSITFWGHNLSPWGPAEWEWEWERECHRAFPSILLWLLMGPGPSVPEVVYSLSLLAANVLFNYQCTFIALGV